MEAHAPGFADHHGADLEELEADGGTLDAGLFAAHEPQAADGVHQSIEARLASSRRNWLGHQR